MAKGIFENIGKGISGVGKAAGDVLQGAGEFFYRGSGGYDIGQQRLFRELEILREKLNMPLSQEARSALVNNFWDKHQRDIVSLQGQNVYQEGAMGDDDSYGVRSGYYRDLPKEKWPEAAEVEAGLKPRAWRTGDEKDNLEQAKAWGVIRKATLDPWGKIIDQETYDNATKNIRRLLSAGAKESGAKPKGIFDNIGGLQLPGGATSQIRSLAEKTAPWLGRAGEPEQVPYSPQQLPKEPAVPPESKPSLWENITKGISKRMREGVRSITPDLLPKRRSVVSPKTARPISGDPFAEIEDMAKRGELGVMSKAYLTPSPDIPTSGDPNETAAYRRLMGIWSSVSRSKAEKILARRSTGESYERIIEEPEIKRLLNVSLANQLSRKKVDGQPITRTRASRIIRNYPKLSHRLLELNPDELREVLAAISDGMSEAEIMRHFKK